MQLPGRASCQLPANKLWCPCQLLISSHQLLVSFLPVSCLLIASFRPALPAPHNIRLLQQPMTGFLPHSSPPSDQFLACLSPASDQFPACSSPASDQAPAAALLAGPAVRSRAGQPAAPASPPAVAAPAAGGGPAASASSSAAHPKRRGGLPPETGRLREHSR